MKALLFLFIVFNSATTLAIDYDAMEKTLKSPEGLEVEIHGADLDHNMFVMVFRNKKDFFDYAQLPLIGTTKAIAAQIAKFHRHDFVRLKGEFSDSIHSAQRHVLVSSAEITKPFNAGFPQLPAYQHEVQLPGDLKGKSELIVKVHAALDDGNIFMVEYKDTNIPVEVDEPERVKNLFRGDKIRIQIETWDAPSQPTHLILKQGDKAVEILSSIAAQDQREVKACGSLVLYMASPDIKFNVFALQRDIGDDLAWTYTLLNQNPTLFAAIRQKLQAAWDAHTQTVIRGRNFYLNPKLQVCADGKGNVIDPTQANPQIFLQSADNITLKEL
jgi:hypothetical protein